MNAAFTGRASQSLNQAGAGPSIRKPAWVRIVRMLAVFRRRQDGVAALEFAFVLPILVLMFGGIVQFGAMFFAQNNMAHVARETARALAVGTIETEAEAQTLAKGRLTNWGVTFKVAADLPDPADPADTDFTVTIAAPLSDLAFFDLLGIFGNGNVTASASMRGEGL